MPSITLEATPEKKVTIPETLNIMVNSNMIRIDSDKSCVMYPASIITEIRKEINRNTGQQAYDNSAIYIYTTAHKNVTPSIRTGQYTEQVFDFIMQHMYGYEKAANPFDETTPNPKQTNWGSGVLGH
jgi:hypothetical protein